MPFLLTANNIGKKNGIHNVLHYLGINDENYEIIIEKLIDKIEDKDFRGHNLVGYAIEEISNNADTETTEELVKKLLVSQNRHSYYILKKLYHKNKLQFLE